MNRADLISEIERLIRESRMELIPCKHCDGTGACKTTAWGRIHYEDSSGGYLTALQGEGWKCDKCGLSVIAELKPEKAIFVDYESRTAAQNAINRPTCRVCGGVGQIRV